MKKMYVLIYGKAQHYYTDNANDALRVYNAVDNAEILYGTPGHYAQIYINDLKEAAGIDIF